ncbi:FecR family protein [Olivibacter sitiensis]|uniref:FecR family protein n=1 Tax=Olivibacter sitiensis TaxID=376470 RepID=UPI0004054437|nr:FecR domain-containing protein [Olivibacter sitiensis]
MSINHQELRELLRRYANGKCTSQEAKLLEEMVIRNPILSNWDWSSEEEKMLMGIRIKQSVDRQIQDVKTGRTKRLWYAGIAASLFLALGVFWHKFGGEEKVSNTSLVISETAAQAPNGTMLVLADGTMVDLDDMDDSLVRDMGAVLIRKLGDGRMVYESTNAGNSGNATAKNTIHTPNGKQFQLTLPDGTQVWMNTASTLTYPVYFNGNERRISLVGEAYFEVAHDSSKPFVVMANGTEILVTGTHFNVSAYPSDNSVRTTLLEGGVEIRQHNRKVSLTPGYEAIAYMDGSAISRQKANQEQAMAWKNGYFVFDDMDIVSVMRSVARWYDITVVVEGNLPNKKFGGTFPITEDLGELLKDLSVLADIQFQQNGKEVRIIR